MIFIQASLDNSSLRITYFKIVDEEIVEKDLLNTYTKFAELQILPVNTKVCIIGKVNRIEEKYTNKNVPMKEIYMLDEEMTMLKVTTFGKIPKEDGLGLRQGRVLEVTGMVSERQSARYISVGYNNSKHSGCKIFVLPKEDPKARCILSQIGQKKKVKGNVSRATIVKPISAMEHVNGELFAVKNCTVTDVSCFCYSACTKCKSSKKEGQSCTNSKCTSRSTKKKDVLTVKMKIKDSSSEKDKQAVMFDNVGTEFIMGMRPESFVRKDKAEQRRLCEKAYLGKQFNMDIFVKSASQWVIQYLRKATPCLETGNP